MKYEEHIHIDAAVDTIFSVMTDVAAWPSWTDSVTDVTPDEPGPLRVGSRVRVKQPGFPAAVWEVTDVVPGSGFTWQNKAPGLTSVGHHYVSVDGKGRPQATLTIVQRGPLSFLLRPYGRRTRRYLGLEANGLKRQAEGAGRPSGSAVH
jgi:hypothetical protein